MSSFYTNFFLRGDSVYYRGYKDGQRIHLKHKYKPFLFIEAPGDYKTIDGKSVKKKRFESITEARGFIETFEKVQNFNLYGLTNFEYAFINEAFPGEIQFDSKRDKPKIGTLDIEVAADEGFPSIEHAIKPITAISLKCRHSVFVFGCGEFKTPRPDVMYIKCFDERELLFKFLNQWEKLDLDIVTGWNVRFFDIPYLVNRLRVLFLNEIDTRLSPWGKVIYKEVEVKGRTNHSYTLEGITVLDYFELYRKFTFTNHESYKLDYISQVELKERKLDYSEYGSLLALYKNNYQKFIEYNIRDVELVERLEDKLGFIELVQELAYDAKCNYIDVLTTIRPWDVIIHNYLMDRKIVIPFFKKNTLNNSIVGGFVKEPKKGLSNWVVSFDLTSLYPHLIMGYNISPDTYIGQIDNLPTIKMGNEDDPEAVTWDVPQAYYFEYGGLYANFHEDIKGCAITANGCKYRNDVQGFMPALMESKFQDRDKYKKEMLKWKKEVEKLEHEGAPQNEIDHARKEASRFKNKQHAKKIQLNSLYGALLNVYNRWFSYNNGESITTTGQLVIKFVDMVLNQHFNYLYDTKGVDYVIASDTDSVYLNMESFAAALSLKNGDFPSDNEICIGIDKYCKDVIQPLLEKSFKAFCLITKAYQEKLFMKRETIATKGLWRAKKMYILNALNEEGVQYDKPKLKMMGIETVRSSTPKVCREAIKKGIEIIMNGSEDDLISYIKEFRQKFNNMPFEDIALPRSVNNIDKYSEKNRGEGVKLYKKGSPIHVKSAILYNYLADVHKLNNLERLHNGDKIKFCYLKLPNPIQENSIGSPGSLPSEFGLDKYLDRNLQFEKTFLNPIKSLTNVIGWETEHIARLF